MILALVLTLTLALAFPLTRQKAPAPEKGIRVLRVWVVENETGGWLKGRAAAYEKQERVRVYLRAASRAEATDALDGEEGTVPPDVVCMPGLETALALRGYGLFVRDEGATPAVPAPTGVLFARPTPEPEAAPEPTGPPERGDLGPVLCPEEMAGCMPGTVTAADPAGDLANGRAGAAVLTAAQAARLSVGLRGYPLPGAFTAVTAQALTDAGEAFIAFLRGRTSQFALRDAGLYSVLPDVRLYGADAPFAAIIEQGLDQTVSSPDAVSTTLNNSRWVPSSASM